MNDVAVVPSDVFRTESPLIPDYIMSEKDYESGAPYEECVRNVVFRNPAIDVIALDVKALHFVVSSLGSRAEFCNPKDRFGYQTVCMRVAGKAVKLIPHYPKDET